MSLKFPISLVGNRFAAAGGGGLPTPLHWWDLDDLGTGAGAGLNDQGNGTNDMSLTAVGTPTVASGDSPDSTDSLRFTSSSAYLHTTSDFAWDGAGNAMSISAWHKVDSLPTSIAPIVSWRDQLATEDRLLDLRVRDDTTDYSQALVFDDATTEHLINAVGSTPNTGVGAGWVHVVCVFDGVDTLDVYVNGNLTPYATDTNALFESLDSTNAMPFALTTNAFSKGAATSYFNGKIWAIGLFDEALTTDNITELYNSGSGGKFADYTWT